MQIARVEASWLHVPIPEAARHRSDYGHIKAFDAAIVRVETECGLVGWGESKNAAGSQGRYGALVHLINMELAPLLVGRDPRDVTAIWEDIHNGPRAVLARTRAHPMPELARSGLSTAALSGVDIALWDILGKSLGVPVWRLLGGRTQSKLRAYASGGWASADEIGSQLKSYIEQGGFRAVKMRVGAMDPTINASAQRVIAAREALGADVELMCDAHGSFALADARRFCHLVRDCDLAWFEEPVSVDDVESMAELRSATAIPLAAGESDSGRFSFKNLMSSRCVDVVQPDLAVCGGLTEGLRVSALASAHGVRLAPHMWAGAPAFAAGLQLMAASPAAYLVEFSLGANPMLHDLIEEEFSVSDGMIEVPERPGIGITVREDFIERYRRV